MQMYILFCHIFMPEIKRSRDKMRKINKNMTLRRAVTSLLQQEED